MEFLKDLSVYLVLFTIIGLPSFFWIKWAFRSFNIKRKLDLIIAGSSYFIFISGWMVMLLAPAKYFKHNASESAFFIYNYFLFSLLFSFMILLFYFLNRISSLISMNFQVKNKNSINPSSKI